MTDHPKVGVATFIRRQGKVLMGKRKGSHGAGSWAIPGGRLEMWEHLEDAARREVLEETGLELNELKRATVTEGFFKESSGGYHFVTVLFVTDLETGEPEVKEPNKVEEWGWFSWDNLPKPLLPEYDDLARLEFNPFTI